MPQGDNIKDISQDNLLKIFIKCMQAALIEPSTN